MIVPNFGEGQLQQCVNTEFTFWAYRNHGVFVSPGIPTLPEEENLGWDSGFYFPWLPIVGLPDQKGCNVFLQYKLSVLIEGPGGGQYSNWNNPYFRFRIPHKTKKNNTYIDDYHQYNALRSLSRNNSEVYYATNQVTTRDELFALSEAQILINNTPFLNVSDLMSQHVYVTFTASSSHFLLHSEIERTNRFGGEMILSRAMTLEPRDLTTDNIFILNAIRDQISDIQGGTRFLKIYVDLDQSEQVSERLKAIRKFELLRRALYHFFGISVIRFIRT
jgi:hypothetical protein